MSFDPWATDEPVSTDGFSTVEAEETASVGNVNVSTEDPIVLTFKQHGGFDAPWVVLRAKTVQEAKDLAASAAQERLFEYVAKAAAAFAGTKPEAVVPSTPRQQSAPQAAPAPPAQSNGGDGRTCSHGTMFYKQGTNKFGKPYTAYFCPAPKGTPDQCRAIFV